MYTREVSVAVCGIVTGVMLGGGILSLQSGSSLASVMQVSYRAVPANIENSRARNVEARPASEDERAYPTIQPEKTGETPVVEPVLTNCEVAKDVVNTIEAVQKKTIPTTLRNTETNDAFATAYAAILKKHCRAEAAAVEAEKPAVRIRKKDNSCYLYELGTPRYTQCRVFEELGRAYHGY
jgi:hypothetical protein